MMTTCLRHTMRLMTSKGWRLGTEETLLPHIQGRLFRARWRFSRAVWTMRLLPLSEVIGSIEERPLHLTMQI